MRPETCCKSEDKDEEGIQNREGMKRRGLHEVKRCKDHKATAGLSVVKGGARAYTRTSLLAEAQGSPDRTAATVLFACPTKLARSQGCLAV